MRSPTSLAGRWALAVAVLLVAALPWVLPRDIGLTWRWGLGVDSREWAAIHYRLDRRRPDGIGAKHIPDKSPAETQQERVHAIDAVLEVEGITERQVIAAGDVRLDVWVPAEIGAARVREIVAASRVGGELQFRIEVRPEYPSFYEGPDGESRTRSRLWLGAEGETPPEKFDDSPDGFAKFKAREIARWQDAREKAEKYVPFDRRYRLVPTYRGEDAPPPSKPSDFVVLEESQNPSECLGGEILSNVRGSVDETGNPAVHFEVKVEYRSNFREWTTKNIGLPMALVLNGLFDQAPTINGPMEDNIQVTLGGGGGSGTTAAERHRMLLERQKNLLRMFRSGSLVIPVTEESTSVGRSPKDAGRARTLMSMALVLVVLAIFAVARQFRARPAPVA